MAKSGAKSSFAIATERRVSDKLDGLAAVIVAPNADRSILAPRPEPSERTGRTAC